VVTVAVYRCHFTAQHGRENAKTTISVLRYRGCWQRPRRADTTLVLSAGGRANGRPGDPLSDNVPVTAKPPQLLACEPLTTQHTSLTPHSSTALRNNSNNNRFVTTIQVTCVSPSRHPPVKKWRTLLWQFYCPHIIAVSN